jgi:replicative DNA helicase
MMINAGVIPDVSAMLAGPDYYQPKHETIHDAILALYARREPVDMVTVAGELTRRGELDRTGGPGYLHTIVSGVQIAANATHYAQLVLNTALARRLIEAGNRVVQMASNGGDMAQVAEDARREVDAAASQVRTAEGGTTLGAGIDSAIDWLEAEPVGAPTPWPDVNDRTNGLLAGQMVTVAARPGHGKSLCAKDVGLFTAMQGRAVHIATLEMSRNEYMTRMLCSVGAVNLSNALKRQMSDQEWARIAAASERVRDLPLYLDDRERQSMAQIRAAARQTQRKYGDLGLLAIDYAQLVTPEDRRLPREQQVAQISRDTKLLAKEFECPVMLLAQLNRQNTSRSDPTPMVSDLRESGALEQDSDQVWLLHRPDQYGGDAGAERLGEVDLIVGKNRNGPAPVAIPLAFQGHYARLVSMV